MGKLLSYQGGHWQKALNAFLRSRWLGLLVAVLALFWRSGWEVGNVFTAGVVGAAMVFAMLHTQNGRKLLFLGWLTAIAVLVLDLAFIEFNWNVLEALLWVLAVGAFWFIDWHRLIRQLQKGRRLSWPSSAKHPSV